MKNNTNNNTKRKICNTFAQHRQMLLMALPAATLLFMFSYMPMFGTLIAFKRYKVEIDLDIVYDN